MTGFGVDVDVDGALSRTRFFCTLFDSNYLFKGVVMLRSLFEHCPEAHVYVLCMDEHTRSIITALGFPAVTCISLAEIESDDLLAVKKGRNIAEYCWTLSPCLPSWVMEHKPEVQFLTYIDADLMFYSSVLPLFEEIGSASIAMIEHRFTPDLQYLEAKGRFCVEWVSFRRDEEGMFCLRRWRDQCLEWCYDRLEDGRMGDQKYLDEWPMRYSSTHILQHAGAGLAPWNYPQYRFSTKPDGSISVDGAPLIFYHFHQFQLLNDDSFYRLSSFYTAEEREPEAIYRMYEIKLKEAISDVRKLVPNFSCGMKSASHVKSRRWAQRFLPRRVKEVLKRIVRY